MSLPRALWYIAVVLLAVGGDVAAWQAPSVTTGGAIAITGLLVGGVAFAIAATENSLWFED